MGIIILIFFTYTLIYFLLPKYLMKEKYILFITSLAALLFVSIVLFYFEFKYGNVFVRKIFHRPAKVWPHKVLVICSLDLVLVNCPIIGGIALGIKLSKRWWLKEQETEQVAKEKTKAELQLLKARIHPHFLFNSLNNIYSFALESSPKTPEMIQKLSGLLHYMLHECNQPQVLLKKELKMIQDYIALEKIRYGERLKLNVHIQEDIDHKMIAPLLLIPFVENSFKHGTSKMLIHPQVNLDIYVDEEMLYFKLVNSRPNGIEDVSVNGNHGLGLKNVKKRLALLYHNQHELQIGEDPSTYTVWMKIALAESALQTKKASIKKEKPAYELA